jgi:hypothetical protein
MAIFLKSPAPAPVAPLSNWGDDLGVGERKGLLTRNVGLGARFLNVFSSLRCICT